MTFDINEKLPIIRLTGPQSDELEQNGHNGVEQLNLPKASYRRVNNQHYARRKPAPKRGDSYYHHVEPDPDTLLNRVEYDMDLEDTHWLESFNATTGAELNFNVSEVDFEKIIDRLEKESYFDNQTSGRNNIPQVDNDAVCAICDDGDCLDGNVILFCDMCDLAVHQECYGIPYIPEGQWLCRRCLQSPLRNVDCCLCPNMGGAFKQTDDNRWAHVICALWIPEVNFANTVFLEPIDNIGKIPPARWRLNCYICKRKKTGACIQCQKPNCYASYHVTCAQQAGLYMKIRTHKYDSPSGPYTDVKKETFCDMHAPADRNGHGGMYSGDDTDEDIDSEVYKKKFQERKKKMKKTRKILAEKREDFMKEDTKIKVDDEKLIEISKLFGLRGKRAPLRKDIDEVRKKVVGFIHNYWELKRAARNGVPLIRRLQSSYYNNASRQTEKDNFDKESFTRLRYDLEKCRLLLGEVKKRELLKRRMLVKSVEIIHSRLKEIDKKNPPEKNNNGNNK